MAMLTTDPKVIGLAALLGIGPTLVWLWFWLRQDIQQPEPKGLITALFVLGMISVLFVIPLEKIVESNFTDAGTRFVLWASIEELMKFLVVIFALYKSNRVDEPIDWAVFMITAALGFAALENTLFLIKPLSLNDTVVGLLTGNLRFLGATLLHAVASGFIGIGMGLSYYMGELSKKLYAVLGILLAIALHSGFNFFIMDESGNNIIRVLGFLWVVTIIVMLLFEKLRRMGN